MIQRIQTLYLIAAFALCIGCLCTPIAHFVACGSAGQAAAPALSESFERVDMYNLWLVTDEGKHLFYFCPILMAVLVIATALVFMDIWLYRRRALQMRVATFSMVLLVAWYVCYGIITWQLLSTEAKLIWRPNWTAALPAAALILLYLAFRGILKDEMLVRSLDRLR